MLVGNMDTTNRDTLKAQAASLLERYDTMRREMQILEHDLARACANYGRSKGVWGFNRNHLRIELEIGGHTHARRNEGS